MAANFTYDFYGRTNPSKVYLARPGKRILGCLNGADENSCSLSINFINANELSLEVYRYIDEEPSAWYDHIDVLMELFVDNYGWFIITESPAVHNDGLKESKTITAKSYEYGLNQYDLTLFDINTATSSSAEMIAPDNAYTFNVSTNVWYNLFRDRVLFYRDTSQHEELLLELDPEASYGELQQLLAKYPEVVAQDWRITIPIGPELRAGFVEMKNRAETAGEKEIWQGYIDSYDSSTGITSDSVKIIISRFPELVKYIKIEFDKSVYEKNSDLQYVKTEFEYTAYELMDLECKRIKGLSLLDLVLDGTGWSVGEVDKELYDTHTDINGTQIQLKDEVGRFEIDSQDVYTFLVNDLSGYFECVFTFDTANNKVNAYRIESLGIDTKIFLGFRNVQNSVDITPAQDLYTQFTVENSEGLGILYANFGERDIEDISYFLNEKYLSPELIDKYERWLEFRESKREEYIEKTRDRNAQFDKTEEILKRVPSDMLNISQLENYTSMNQVEEVIGNYYAQMIGILNTFIYVSIEDITPPKARETYDTFTDYTDAMDAYIEQLESHVDENKDHLAIPFEDSLYYDDYQMMKEFTVPNLIITYTNLTLPSYETQEEYYDSFEYNFDEKEDGGYGWMYGVYELQTYQQYHLDHMEVMKDYAEDWDDLPAEYQSKFVKQDYDDKHSLYLKYKGGYDSATAALAIRQAEYDAEMEILNNLEKSLADIASSVKKENFEENGELVFSHKDLLQLARLLKHTDYSNDNIAYLQNIDTSSSVIDKHLEMYKEATDELYVESHPQYTYATSVDDLLANNEYEAYHPEFEVGNFIRLGLDDETQVKLRMIGIQLNPMIYDNNLQLTFSNMINYRGKRNDFAGLLNSAITSAKNSISARYNRSADADNTIQVTYDLVQKILQNPAFTNMTQNIQANSVNAAAGTFNALAAGYIKTDELAAEVANITELHSDSAFVNYLNSNLVVANAVKAQTADVADLSTKSLNSETADIATLATEAVTAQSIDASNINVDSLFAESGLFEYLEANLVVASEIKVDDLKAKLAQVDALAADSAFVQFLETDITTAKSLTAEAADLATVATKALTADSIKAENIDTETITAQSGFYQYLQTVSSTTATAVINDAYIKNSVMANVSIADLAVGTIVLTDQMTIVSQNENGGNVYFDGDALQFTDSEGNVGIEIGYGSQSYPHIIITDENGTSLWTSTGITSDGIGNDVIYGRMINDATISREKLNFPIVETDEDGNISITNILDAEGGSFGVEYQNFKDSVTGMQSIVDNVNQSITNKIWQSDIDAYDESTGKAIRDRVSLTEQDIGKIVSKVTDITGSVDDLGRQLSTAESEIQQNADRISAMVTVNGQSSSFTLTDKMIQAITNQFVVTGSDGTTTVISGGNIQSNSISATDLSVDAIKSRNYSDPLDSNSRISTAGTFLDLANGDIYSPIFGINTADKTGKISGLNITESSIYSGNKNAVNSTENGFFLDNIGQMNIGDEYNYIASWYDAAEARWKISISADSIMLGTGESVADIAKNASSLVYDQDYEIYDDRVEFEAHLYKNGEDVRNLYDEYSFSWYIKNDNGMSLYGQGYTIEIPIEEFQYGGSVVGRFIDDNLFDIVDNSGNTLVSSDVDTIIAYRNTLPNR